MNPQKCSKIQRSEVSVDEEVVLKISGSVILQQIIREKNTTKIISITLFISKIWPSHSSWIPKFEKQFFFLLILRSKISSKAWWRGGFENILIYHWRSSQKLCLFLTYILWDSSLSPKLKQLLFFRNRKGRILFFFRKNVIRPFVSPIYFDENMFQIY